VTAATTRPGRERDVGHPLSDIGPRRRVVEIEGPDGKLLARWEGWSWTARGAVARADALRTGRQPQPARRSRSTR